VNVCRLIPFMCVCSFRMLLLLCWFSLLHRTPRIVPVSKTWLVSHGPYLYRVIQAQRYVHIQIHIFRYTYSHGTHTHTHTTITPSSVMLRVLPLGRRTTSRICVCVCSCVCVFESVRVCSSHHWTGEYHHVCPCTVLHSITQHQRRTTSIIIIHIK
jgi:hypothetical protein